MSRRNQHEEEHENHERWLVSYADFITLLFAFFTVLYATAQTDQEKLEAVINGMNAAFEGGMPHALLDVLALQTHPPDTPTTLPNHLTEEAAQPVVHSLHRTLGGTLSDNVVQIGLVDQDLVLVLPERMLFATGSAELHPSAYAALTEIAKALAESPVEIEVQGHADGAPVAPGGIWADNWDLASARAIATVRYLERHRVPPSKLRAVARVEARVSAEARAVTIRVHVPDVGPASEVIQELGEAGQRLER